MKKKNNGQAKQNTEHPAEPKKPTDRSGHMAWSHDDVEHHGAETPAHHQLQSFKKWKAENS